MSLPDSAAAAPAPSSRLKIPLTPLGWPELVLLALVHRSVIAAWTTSIAADGTRYLPAVELYRDGRFREALETTLHPLYLLLAGLLARLTGDVELSAVIVSVAAGALLPVPLYLLVKKLWNERVAWVTGFLYALQPTLALDTTSVYPTSLFLLLFFSAAACGVYAVTTPRWYLYPAAGALAGLCYLTRTEGIHAAAFLGGCMVWFGAWALLGKRTAPDGGSRTRDAFRRTAGLLTCAVVFVLVCLPYLGFVREKLGRWNLTLKAGLTLVDRALMREEGASGGTAAERIASHTTVWQYMGKKLSRAVYPVLIPFYIAGFFCVRRQGGDWRRLVPLAVMSVLAFVPSLLLLSMGPNHTPDHRYMLLSGMLLLPWAAAAVATIGDVLTDARRAPFLREWGWAAVLGFVLVLLPIKSLRPLRAFERTLVAAGTWLREQPLGEKRVLVSSNDKLSYYGRCIHVALPSPAEGHSFAPKIKPNDPSPDPAKTLEWSRLARKEFDLHGGALLAVDQKAVEEYLGADYLKQLEAVGFRSKKVVAPRPGEKALTIWFFEIGAP